MGESTAKFCLQTCLPNSFLSENEPENLTSKLTPTSVSASRRFFATTTATSFFPSTQFTNHESLPSIEEAYAQFIQSYPNYSQTYQIDEIRVQEYYHLSLSNHVFLDYIGIGLFSFSQLHNQLYLTYPEASSSSMAPQDSPQISDLPLFTLSYRSVNLKSELSKSAHQSALESSIKRRLRDFLKINEDDYSLVFIANRTSAFKLLAESYPFQSHKKLVTVYDHESEAVDAMITNSSKRGAQAMQAEFAWPRLRICSTKLKSLLEGNNKKKKKKRKGLFIFQLQSRLTGARYSYQWMKIAQENGWHVLLDACALGPKDMDSLGLSLLQPDFLVCSFYKVFGENPSGFGCLFVKKSELPILDDSTIVGIASITSGNRFLSPPDVSSLDSREFKQLTIQSTFSQQEQLTSNDAFTGPLSSAQIPSSGRLQPGEDPGISANSCNTEHDDPTDEIVESESSTNSASDPHQVKRSSAKIEFRCLDHVDSLGLTLINTRRRYLTNWLIHALLKLHHPSAGPGIPLVRIYGPKVKFDRGPALAFNIFDWKGQKVEPPLVQKLGDRRNISLSTGFLQNIWFSEKYQLDKNRVLEKKRSGSSFGMMNGEAVGGKRKGEKDEVGVKVVTAAIGYLANFEDAYRLWAFVSQFLDADFVEKERWRYRTLDQTTLEI